MHIVFSPPLGETVHVSAGRTRKPTALLHFTATLNNPADYEQVASGHVKLQVWSEIPGNGRHAGEWGEAEFKPVHSVNGSKKHVLVASYRWPTREPPYSGLLLYPDGAIKWLGDYGHNGTLVLNWTDLDPVILDEHWVLAPGNDSYLRESTGRAVHDLQVARLAHPFNYMVYPAGENSFFGHKDSSLIVLVPRLNSHPVIVPPTLIFGATPSCSISFTPAGTITMSGSSSLSFVACESPEEAEIAVSRVINHCSSPQVVNYAPGVLVLASTADKYPVEVAVVPIASCAPVVRSDLTLRSLAAVVSGKAAFFMFSSLHRAARFIEDESDESIAVKAGQSGGQFVAAPAHTVIHGEDQWQIGIMSSHSPASLPSAHAEGLPTPPPSPRLRPLPHRVSESPDPSFLNLAAPMSTSGEQTASPSSSQLVVHSSKRRGVLALMWRIFVVLFGWMARLLGRRRVDVPPKRMVDERTPLLQQEQPRVEVSTPDVLEPQASSSEQAGASGISFDVDSGQTTILFQATRPASFNVPVLLNGRNIDSDITTSGALKIG
ncbi:RING finger protein 8 [Mycena sanguinolenta]|uniref:RING finger protein 8 n=1 Tax=Mycena sanguinolenta TaxID=230812 RepID=A0A8H6XFH5_9AGAR|nr:RING finger protein 8 [Mycena sanguinolenta]